MPCRTPDIGLPVFGSSHTRAPHLILGGTTVLADPWQHSYPPRCQPNDVLHVCVLIAPFPGRSACCVVLQWQPQGGTRNTVTTGQRYQSRELIRRQPVGCHPPTLHNKRAVALPGSLRLTTSPPLSSCSRPCPATCQPCCCPPSRSSCWPGRRHPQAQAQSAGPHTLRGRQQQEVGQWKVARAPHHPAQWQPSSTYPEN